jgi:acyl transferase domain-containing protein/thioesterase domain-containing protein
MKPASIAIVGMAGRFPGARNIAAFWQNLRDGVESIRTLSDSELLASGASQHEIASPLYVKRASVLDDVPMLDASFFGLSPRDASIMDPQHRHFLECAWEALEDAGHPPKYFDGSIGVFAGSGMNTYLIHNLLANRELVETAGLFQLKQTGNDKDVLATRVSYQFDLRGPSINVQTACSTSLVAVHLACQSLLNYECDLALAGGVTIENPHGQGYIYREGEILSRDGHCRSFDASSSGTVFGSGVGAVVLRRLEDALEDRDNIRAVILGTAINNDGARKVSYLAPSVDGQADVIAEALDVAGVGAETISYVEAHGTGTVIGDPIEVRGLTQAFRKSTQLADYCGIGSLKSNVGHLDAAAGVAGLIKTVLALEHSQVPASLHFERLNPYIELEGSPFFVNSQLRDWPSTIGSPRRASVTALGIGGTNAHVVLEEAPQLLPSLQASPCQLLTVSAKTASAADRAVANLANYLQANPELNLADVAFTCHLGRQAFSHRRAWVVNDSHVGISSVLDKNPTSIAAGIALQSTPSVVFMFSGQGSQHVNMGRDLYRYEPVFEDSLDQCAELLLHALGFDLRQVLYPPQGTEDAAADQLNQTWLTQPALFAVEYALARWWMSLGVEPAAMVGHSIGEYVAACLAGVFSLQDALAIAAIRGRMMHDLPRGSMLAVSLPPRDLHLTGNLCLAAINGARLCVVSGPTSEIADFEERLSKESISCHRVLTSHAFHSGMMDRILGEFEQRVRSIELNPPRIPYFSNLSGTWIEAEEATDPGYWARHLRQTVRFSDALAELSLDPNRTLIEIGPGTVLTSLARQQLGPKVKAVNSLPHPRDRANSLRCILQSLGQAWSLGVDVDWAALHSASSGKRVPLPTYPFEHRKFWIDPDKSPLQATSPSLPESPSDERGGLSFYRRLWKQQPQIRSSNTATSAWIVFNDSTGLGDQTVEMLNAKKEAVILVGAGAEYRSTGDGNYSIRPGARDDYDALIADVILSGQSPKKILHLWSVENSDSSLDETIQRSFNSPLYLAQALARQDLTGIDIAFVSNRLQQVSGEPVRNPARAVFLGPARVIPKELPGMTCRSLDVDVEGDTPAHCATQIVAEMESVRENAAIAFRGSERFVEQLEPFQLSSAPDRRRLQPGGVYLITGGLGGLGLVVAEHLAREFKARLVLVGRSALPPESNWESALNEAGQTDATKRTIRKLIELRSVADGLLVIQADVTNLDQMRDAVSDARRQFGTIDGVFHAAGVLDDGSLMLKTAENAARVLSPKVLGTLVLEEALRDHPLSCFVLFSSISSIRPPAGQIDYAAANAFLDAFALSRNPPVTVVNWGMWREVGMGARTASAHPFLQERLLVTPQEIVYSGRFSKQDQWLLSEHRLKDGRALIPGTGYLEMAAAAFAREALHGTLEFSDVFFLAPLTFDAAESKEVRVQLMREQDAGPEKNAFHFSIFARGDHWVEHCSGNVAPCLMHRAKYVDRAAITARCQQREIVFDQLHRTRQEHQFKFGPRWQSLRRIKLGNREALGEIVLEDRFHPDLTTLRIHPALLDMATGASLYLIEDYDQSDDLFLPISYKRMCVYQALPGRFFTHIRSRREGSPGAQVETFDISVFNEHGQALAEIEGFAMRRIRDAEEALKLNSVSLGAARSGDQPIEIPKGIGIAPHDGARALTRILMTATPVAVVVTSDPSEVVDDEPSSSNATAGLGAIPAQAIDDIERTLTAWWQDLLGVEHVGLDDDFFALGGHSLVGVRLFGKIKKAWQVDLELAVLFEARTVRQLAEVVRKSNQPATLAPKSWATLVPIQPNGSRTPLFCVHAVGGDVIFYEQLARALGPDQPFYAFQSPLVSKIETRHVSIEELASMYVREMRSFFPQGPYLIGGASFGGLVAFEMAKQLYAQGAKPRLLVLFDTSIPGNEQRVAAKDRVASFLNGLRKQGATYLTTKAAVKRVYWGDKMLRRLRLIACASHRLVRRRLPVQLHYFQVEEAHKQALTRYSFHPYGGKITLMRAVDRGPEVLGKREDPTLGWARLAEGGLEIHDVETGHMSMLFEPYVEIFVQQLKPLLGS